MAISNEQIVNQPFLYANGGTASRASTTTLTVTAGIFRDSTNTYDINVGNYLGVNPNTSASVSQTINGATNGLNGLDTGSLGASKMYAIHAIYAPSDNLSFPSGYMLSLSLTAPTLPFGYSAFRVVGYWPTNGSSQFILGYMTGLRGERKFTYDAPLATAITAGNATTYTAISLAASAPAIDNMTVNVKTAVTPSAAGRGVLLQGGNSTGDAIVNLGQVTSVVLNNANDVLAQLVAGVPTINYKVSNSSDAVAINVNSFTYSV